MIDHHQIGTGKIGAVTQRLDALFNDVVRGKTTRTTRGGRPLACAHSPLRRATGTETSPQPLSIAMEREQSDLSG